MCVILSLDVLVPRAFNMQHLNIKIKTATRIKFSQLSAEDAVLSEHKK
jgi:hypothetical protein